MFLVRSAFWLTMAYMVLAPVTADFGSTAQDAGSDLVRGGQSLIAAGIEKAPPCENFECAAGRAILMGAVSPTQPDAASTPNAPKRIEAVAAPEPVQAAVSPSAPIPPRRPESVL